MSLGYVKGKYWVADDYYKSFTEWETYKALSLACRAAGITFNCEYSYTTRRYTAEVVTIETIRGQHYVVKHGNAYDEHPMLAITAAIRTHDHGSLLLSWLCIEMDIRVIAQKLLPVAKLEHSIDDMLALVRSV